MSKLIHDEDDEDYKEAIEQSKIDDDEYESALAAANEAYEEPHKRKSFMGYHHDTNSSTKHEAVYIHPEKKHVIIGYRGTAALGDVLPDSHIGLGTHKHAARFKQSIDKYDSIRKLLPNHDITVSGHSLGGSLARHVSKERNVKASAFNPGESAGYLAGLLGPLGALFGHKQVKAKEAERRLCDPKNPNRPSYCDKLTIYNTKYDPVSHRSNYGYGKIFQKAAPKNVLKAHGLDTFKGRPQFKLIQAGKRGAISKKKAGASRAGASRRSR